MAKVLKYVGKFSAVTVPLSQQLEVLFVRGGEGKPLPDAVAEAKLKDEPGEWNEVTGVKEVKESKKPKS